MLRLEGLHEAIRAKEASTSPPRASRLDADPTGLHDEFHIIPGLEPDRLPYMLGYDDLAFRAHPMSHTDSMTRGGKGLMDLGNGAGDGIRTRDIQLGRLALYQLSYSRPEEPASRRPYVGSRWQFAHTISHVAALSRRGEARRSSVVV
jgi:hypothetical protein